MKKCVLGYDEMDMGRLMKERITKDVRYQESGEVTFACGLTTAARVTSFFYFLLHFCVKLWYNNGRF